MTHQRTIIRNQVASTLTTAAIVGSGNVYKTRMLPFRTAELPALTVYTLDETSTVFDVSPRMYERKATLEVVAAIVATDAIDDDLDALALGIETALDADIFQNDTCSDSILTAMEVAIDEGGQKPIGMLRMTYEFTYYTNPGIVPTDDFGEVDAKWNLNDTQAIADQAEDDFTIETE